MREQTLSLWNSFPSRQKLLIGVVTVGVIAAMYALIHNHRESDYKPLYTSLAPEDASAVVNQLRTSGVDYRLGDGGSTVLVRSGRVADARLLIAGAGLPKTGRIGFELFDRTNFGASEFSEQVNYRRALEGELERSVMALSEVEHARVHITAPKDSVFVESRQPAKASVLVKLRVGARLEPANVNAIVQLVASAVEGLAPDAVTVVDMQGNLLSRRHSKAGPDGMEPDGVLDYRQRVEHDLLAKIYSTLEPVLGGDHFRAGVTVEMDITSGEESEESWDPDRSVVVTQQRSEELGGAPAASGVPGTASNLPRPQSRPGSGSAAGVVRRSENVTYQTSRTVRRTKIPQGAIRRISVSAIVDQDLRWEGTGPKAKQVLSPPSEDKLKKVKDLVAAAIGYNEQRGDQIVVETLAFESTLRASPPGEPSTKQPPRQTLPFGLDQWLSEKNNMIILAAIAGGVFLLLILAVFLLLRKRGRKARVQATDTSRAAVRGESAPAQLTPPDAVTGSTLKESIEARLTAREQEQHKAELEVLESLKLPEVTTKKGEVLVKHISEHTRRDPAAVAQLIRSWIEEKGRY